MKDTSSLLVDRYRRHLSYLRISVTDRCNLRCLYCMPREGTPKLRHEEVLSYEEILRVTKIAVNHHGITKVRLTGGEPLVRKGFCGFIGRLTHLKGLRDISLTTNAVLLEERLDDLKRAGITRLNISLDSLLREKYRYITGFDRLHRVLEGIKGALEAGFQPVKINMVVMGGINDEEILNFARLSLEYPYHVRFIEYMPIGVVNPGVSLQHVPTSRIRSELGKLGVLDPVAEDVHDGPAERFKFRGAPGEIGFIGALSRHFCHKCNRMRLTSSGQLRPCLLSDSQVDLMGPLRNGASDDELSRIFLQAARGKPEEHRLDPDSKPLSSQMSAIGG